MVPTRRLALLALAVALSLVLYPARGASLAVALLVVNGVLLALALVDGLAGVHPRHLHITRDHAPVVVMGRPAELRWTVRNDARRSATFRFADELAPSLGADHRRVGARLSPGSTATLATGIRPSRRGRFAPSEIVVRVDGPLGLMSRQRRRQVPTALRVHPPFRSREEAELRVRRARLLQIGRRSVRGLGGSTEFEALREYTPDDEFRRVDWAASARAGKPIVRTYRPERNQSVVVLLDNGRLMAGRVDGVPRLEHAMDAVMMLTAVATGLGDKVGLVTFDREVRTTIPPGSHRDQLTRVTEAMFDLEPVLAESDYTAVFRHTLARFRRRSLLVILTELDAGSVVGSLLPALPLISRNHLVVVGAVLDPAVARWADEPPIDVAGAYRKTAAIAALAERRRLVARMRGLGVTVVDAVPGALSTSLADVYLNVKSSGRL